MLYCSQLRETKGGSTLCGIAFFFLSQASPVKDAVHPSLVAMTEFEADCFPQKHSCFELLIFIYTLIAGHSPDFVYSVMGCIATRKNLSMTYQKKKHGAGRAFSVHYIIGRNSFSALP